MNLPAEAILKIAADRQLEAIAPDASIWVAASAGTGKTTVLTNRVLYLMLNGTPPERILCLTFTKAAAAEMSNRIAERLEKWTSFDDKQLTKDILGLTSNRPSEERRLHARQLFARVLDVAGGLKIQTIHSFCQSLLKRFPLESGVAPHFDVLDERGAAELMHETREAMLRRARPDKDAALHRALIAVTAVAGEEDFTALLHTLGGESARLQHLMDRLGSLDAILRSIRDHLGVGRDDTAETILRAACQTAAFDSPGLRLAAETLKKGSDAEASRGARIAEWLASDIDRRVSGFDEYAGNFITDGGTVRASLANKATVAAMPGIVGILTAEAERLIAAIARINAAGVAAATAALLTLALAMLEDYRRRKERRALLDYDDLIRIARDLLRRPGVAPWVLYKLDGGLDHILIDEAQDTNPEQWEVVASLAEEFFAGEGARGETRTVFAVGDVKQSIYGFQRADPASFKRMHDHFHERVNNARGNFHPVELTVSFRSTKAVLDTVNAIFGRPAAQHGLLLSGAWPVHQAARFGQAGLVELWPPARPRERDIPQPWQPLINPRAGDSPRHRLARLIATRIRGMIENGERLESKDRPVEPGDFLILVRRRNELVEELVRELKQLGVPVAGVDRMMLMEQLAVMDLVALGHFLLLPDDDLTLATVLKSPLIGFGEDDLYALAEPREGRLWQELKRRAAERPIFARAREMLAELLARADFQPPYELYGDLLGRGGGRLALLSRLGPDAADALDEFLNLALEYQRGHAPSLQGFLQWLGSGDVEIKRDLDQGLRGQVRIMTVHGAKGLEAPIVFLPDTMQMPKHAARLLWSKADKGLWLPLWSPRRSMDEARLTEARAALKQAEIGEQQRLLYVALTRAADRLYICGWHGRQKPPADCWYFTIQEGLRQIGQAYDFDCAVELKGDSWRDTGYRYASDQQAKPEPARPVPRGTRPVPTPTPSWFRAPAPLEPARPRPLAPSRPAGDEPPVRSPAGPEDGRRFRRGVIIHQLLQLLPDVALDQREAACRRFLARSIHELSAAEQEEIAEESLRVLAEPGFAPLFGPGSRAEVPIAGEIAGLAGSHIVSGQIDRLLVSEESVLVVDYKSNRPPPMVESEVPAIYLRQMAAYRALLAHLYENRPVRCALLWTDGPLLMPLSSQLLDRHLP
jgi:ATP-dependent helicase/nuclease subunit A